MTTATLSPNRMASTLKPYKGYVGQLEVDAEAGILYGEVIDLKDVIAFEGRTVEEAAQSFHDSVDAYLEFCKELGQKPEKPFSGQIPFRTNAEHHRMIFTAARIVGKSVNAWMDDTLITAAGKILEACGGQVPSDERSVSAAPTVETRDSVRKVTSTLKSAPRKKARGNGRVSSR